MKVPKKKNPYEKNLNLETEAPPGLISRAMDWLGSSMIDIIPSDDAKVYHPKYNFPLALLIIAGFVGVFLGLFVPTITSQLRSRYLSPLGAENSKSCEMVPISTTGQYLASKDGIWSGSNDFHYSVAAYAFRFSNVQYTPETYHEDLARIYDTLSAAGYISRLYELGTSLSFWMSFVIIPTHSPQSRFNLNGNPLTVFSREKVTGAISTVNGICMPPSTVTTYSSTSGMLSLTFQYEDLMKDPICNSSVNPQLFGFLERVENGRFTIAVDVRALVTSFAVNVGILSLGNLERVVGTERLFSGSVDGVVNRYFDPRYPHMNPIACLSTNQNSTNANSCFMQFGDVITIPFFRHSGMSNSLPKQCNCSDPNLLAQLSNPRHPCNIFSLLSGLLYYNIAGPGGVTQLGLAMAMQQIANRGFFAMYAASSYGMSSVNASYLTSPEYLRSAFSFCNLSSYGYCNIITFTSWDESVQDYSVNEYFYQLNRGACRDTFSTNQSSWKKLVDTPFAPLSQEYEVCRENMFNAVVNAMGVTSGNVGLLAPFIIMFFLALAVWYQSCFGVAWPRGYHQNEKDAVVDQFATLMLLLRDDKLSSPDGHSKRAVRKLQISRLAREFEHLSCQLVKQYESDEQHSHHQPKWWHRVYSSMKKRAHLDEAKEGESYDIEEAEGHVSDRIPGIAVPEVVEETHYGRYELVPARQLMEKQSTFGFQLGGQASFSPSML